MALDEEGEVVAIRFSSRLLHHPMGGVAPRHRFFHFLRVCPICSSSVAGCDDWDGFQGSGTVQMISQA
ncbi:hypothetical protein ACUIHB_06040 [Aeromonas veronii]|uniref:hypothetical protein n=1 Tax=Aeromonas veronii TaxID=654 RepID=UPI00403DD701